MGVSTLGRSWPSHHARRTISLRWLALGAAMVNQTCVITPGPCALNTSREPPGGIARKSALPLERSVAASRADWVKSTFITDDTEILAAAADQQLIGTTVDLVKEAAPYTMLALPEDLARKLKLLKLSLTIATPADPAEAAELTR